MRHFMLARLLILARLTDRADADKIGFYASRAASPGVVRQTHTRLRRFLQRMTYFDGVADPGSLPPLISRASRMMALPRTDGC